MLMKLTPGLFNFGTISATLIANSFEKKKFLWNCILYKKSVMTVNE